MKDKDRRVRSVSVPDTQQDPVTFTHLSGYATYRIHAELMKGGRSAMMAEVQKQLEFAVALDRKIRIKR